MVSVVEFRTNQAIDNGLRQANGYRFENYISGNSPEVTSTLPSSKCKSHMTFDNMEENEPCEFCGLPVQFFDDDWMRCSGCGAEYSNMDYTGDQIIEDLE